MKIYLDKNRPCPPGFIPCCSAHEAIYHLATGLVRFIIFGHDLASELTGYDVACFIEDSIAEGTLRIVPAWHIHSTDHLARQNIKAAMESAKRLAGQGHQRC